MDRTAILEGGTSQHDCCDGATPFNVALSVESWVRCEAGWSLTVWHARK
jgi:hypothetical protein